MFTRRMHDRRFVWTWWAGMVPDSFGARSLFCVARWGSLRVRRVIPTAGVARRGTAVGMCPLVPITKLCSHTGIFGQ